VLTDNKLISIVYPLQVVFQVFFFKTNKMIVELIIPEMSDSIGQTARAIPGFEAQMGAFNILYINEIISLQ
jgi:hypothetical protein